MKYYLHDTSAFDDEKVSELYIKFGYEGVGLFYVILEKIGKQEKPVKTSVLKSQLKVGKRLEKVWSFMEEIGIISSNNGETFNKQLLNFSEKYKIKKEKTREKVLEWRKNQQNAENVTGYVPICNQHKVKESKVKESKVKEINIAFDVFWDLYDKKVGEKSKLQKKWESLKDDDRIAAIEYIPRYKEAQPEKQYRKDPSTFLNNKSWNDEIITRSPIKQSWNDNSRSGSGLMDIDCTVPY